MSDENGKARGPSQAPPTSAVDGPAGKHHKPQRFSAKMKSRIAFVFFGERTWSFCAGNTQPPQHRCPAGERISSRRARSP